MGDNKISLFIFRRDLRLIDNTGLNKALSESKKVIPLFILTPYQISERNKFKSSNAIQFMMESLIDLDNQIRKINPLFNLLIRYGDEIDVLTKIKKEIEYQAIYVNEDYTPYSITRDKKIKKFCISNNIKFDSSTDVLLLDTNEITAANGNYYKIFTQFYNKAIKIKIRKPNMPNYTNFKPIPTSLKKFTVKKLNQFILNKKHYEINPNIAIEGGRTNGLKIINNIHKFNRYSIIRNDMSEQTTMLSPHNKFGTVSIREVYKSMKKIPDLSKQLYWRDFYYYVSVHFDGFYEYRHINHPTLQLKWTHNSDHLNLWKEGKTGFPIVDSAMVQLNTTGFMHNRGRMIVASFLVKDLLIDWKYGERYFSQKLIDIDRAQNTGNWNWSSSMGLDAISFLRIFNPWTQSKEYDPDAKYIKKWLPKLSNIPSKELHNWYKYHNKYSLKYPQPIVDHSIQRIKFINLYKSYFQ